VPRPRGGRWTPSSCATCRRRSAATWSRAPIRRPAPRPGCISPGCWPGGRWPPWRTARSMQPGQRERREMAGAKRLLRTTVNGRAVEHMVPVRLNLVDFLRNVLELTGSHVGCEHGVCGACTVRVDGEIVRGCLMFAVQAEGRRIETIEGLTES